MFNLEFTTTLEEYLDYQVNYYKSKDMLKKIFITKRIILILLTFAMFIVAQDILRLEVSFVELVIVILCCIMVYFVYPSIYYSVLRKKLKKQVVAENEKEFFKRTSIGVTNDGIKMIQSAYECKIGWEIVKRIEDSNNGIYIYIEGLKSLIVPKRAFQSTKEADDFLGFCKDMRKKGKLY